MLCLGLSARAADLADLGPNGEFFHDPDAGLYWLDIAGYRWLGFYAEPDPDGWLVQTTNGPSYDTITATSSQSGAASLNTGGWFVSTVDPVAAPRLEDAGDDGEFLVDHATGLFWRDPEHFVGLTRGEVETWLAGHPGWRWATAAEFYRLGCRLTVGDVQLEAVLGAWVVTEDDPTPTEAASWSGVKRSFR